jgi:UDP-N-acetylglucosamine 2-epimerase (non-hydrolysing)
MKPCLGIVLGTRPEVIKLPPVVHRLRVAGWCRVAVLPSGQHGHMLRQALAGCRMSDVDVPPPPPPTSDPAQQVERLAGTLGQAIARARPDAVLVQGDTATALAGAIAAARFDIPVCHVEAGLRTHDLRQPYPEEGNRRAIARLARLHFAPTPLAAANLLDEGCPADRVFVTGNTIVDAMLGAHPASTSPERVRPFGIVTLHRRELLPHVGLTFRTSADAFGVNFRRRGRTAGIRGRRGRRVRGLR